MNRVFFTLGLLIIKHCDTSQTLLAGQILVLTETDLKIFILMYFLSHIVQKEKNEEKVSTNSADVHKNS